MVWINLVNVSLLFLLGVYYFQLNQLFLAFCWGVIFAALRGGSTCRLLKRSVAGPVRLVQPCDLGFWSWMTLSIDILFFIHVYFQENISDICKFYQKTSMFCQWFWDVYLLSCFRNWKFQLPRVSTPRSTLGRHLLWLQPSTLVESTRRIEPWLVLWKTVGMLDGLWHSVTSG